MAKLCLQVIVHQSGETSCPNSRRAEGQRGPGPALASVALTSRQPSPLQVNPWASTSWQATCTLRTSSLPSTHLTFPTAPHSWSWNCRSNSNQQEKKTMQTARAILHATVQLRFERKLKCPSMACLHPPHKRKGMDRSVFSGPTASASPVRNTDSQVHPTHPGSETLGGVLSSWCELTFDNYWWGWSSWGPLQPQEALRISLLCC